jgi:hypothetical protein
MKKFLVKVPVIVFIAIVALIVTTLAVPSAPAQAAEATPQCWGVFVGISNYLDSEICPPLYVSGDDAQGFSEALGAVWGSDHMKIILDSQATKQGILDAIAWLAQNAGPDDLVVFTYTGHGAAGGYLTTYDCNDDNTSMISADELAAALKPVNASKVVIILENCYAGAFKSALSSDGRVVLMASKSYEVGWVDPNLGHFVYGYYVIKAFKIFNSLESSIVDTNQDYELSAEEIAAYASKMTIQYEEQNDFESIQHPTLFDGSNGDLDLIAKFIFQLNDNLPAGTPILTIDGISYTTVPSYLLWIPGLSHTLKVPQIINDGTGSRYNFNDWNDGDTSTMKVVSQGLFTAYYNLEQLLSITSKYGDISGAGWYKDDTTASFSVTSFIETPDTRHIFTGWSGDFTSTSPEGTLYMNAPKTLTADWRTEYVLNLNSEYGTPVGSGWHNEDESVNISVDPVQGFIIRHIFDDWTGDFTSDQPNVTLTMNAPKAITAVWHTDYMQLYILIVVILVVAGIVTTIILVRRKSVKPPAPPAATPPPPASY